MIVLQGVLQVVVDAVVFAVLAAFTWVLCAGVTSVMGAGVSISYATCFLAVIIFHEILDSYTSGAKAARQRIHEEALARIAKGR